MLKPEFCWKDCSRGCCANEVLVYAHELPQLCSVSGTAGNGPPLVFMKHTLTFVWALSGAVLAIVEFTIRAQINRCVPPDQCIGLRELQNPYVWFGERGLLARHASLYPGSRLVTAFRLLWATFWVLMAAWILQRPIRPR
jgi:hypothetical protein